MSATNALTISVHQTATSELRTSTPGRSRRKEGLISFVRVLQALPNTISPFPFTGNLAFVGSWLVIANLRSEILPTNLKHFRAKLKCLALYQVLTKNFTRKAEMPEMLKCHFGPRPLSNPLVSWFETIWIGFRNLVVAVLPLETAPETFQGVSRTAETLAIQMNPLREFSSETIKKNALKRLRARLPANTVLILQGWDQSISNSPNAPGKIIKQFPLLTWRLEFGKSGPVTCRGIRPSEPRGNGRKPSIPFAQGFFIYAPGSKLRA
jgi:hypothetical protein